MPDHKADEHLQDWLKGCTCFRLRRTSRRMTQIYDAHLAAVGLTLTQYSLLAHLARMEPPTVHALAGVMGMDRTTLSRNLKPLLARALLIQKTGEDRRSRLIAVTEAGRDLWTRAKPLWRAAQNEIRQRLGDQDTAELHRLLDDTFSRLEGGE
ncbi:MAG TPA: MarR family winged helix-turn-helix transcriptional regulator [Candidatus Sulfotelmatobacter sp.]|jgi:DNA-binding MarR family transcriptional regulator|nr:MarR family winged helix-turn-helix transcriptional regulator [Candidatus Sulfotelmatobacter sp.]